MSPATYYLCIFGHATQPLCISVNGVDKNIFLPKVIEKIKWSKTHLKIFSTLGCTKCNLLLVGTQPSSQEPLWRGCPRLDFWEGGRERPTQLDKGPQQRLPKGLVYVPCVSSLRGPFPFFSQHFLSFLPVQSLLWWLGVWPLWVQFTGVSCYLSSLSVSFFMDVFLCSPEHNKTA